MFDRAKPMEPISLAQNHEFKEALKYNIGWTGFILARYQETIDDVTALIEQIVKQLELME